MIDFLKKRFALSDQGAKSLIKATLSSALVDLVLIAPVGVLYLLVDDMLRHNELDNIFYIAASAFLIALTAIFYMLQYNACYRAAYAESGVQRISVAEKLRKIPLSFFSKKDLADLTSVMMNDCKSMEEAFSHYIPQFFGAIIAFVPALGLFFFDWRMAIASLWVIPVSLALIFLTHRFQHKFFKQKIDVEVSLSDEMQQAFESMRDLKSNHAEKQFLDSLERKIDLLEKKAFSAETGIGLPVLTAQLILKFGIATTALTGAFLFNDNAVELMVFFAFLLVVSRLYDSFSVSLIFLAAMISTKVIVDRMNLIYRHPVQEGKCDFNPEHFDLEFRHVAFSYDDDTPVLRDVSFIAKQGEITALVGPSGGGKTTISRLAARFWDPTKGVITLGGQDISEIDPETLLRHFSIVFQDVVLFDNTVMENIRIGKKDASDEEVLEAARLANCDAFVQRLPQGYQTLIGENGCRLSGGERQRLSVARAILKNAPIILLDEATASLDVESESLVQQALSRLLADRTVLVVAHRMRTVAGADKIIALENGVIAEQGTHDELYRLGGLYRHIFDLQQSDGNWVLKQ